MGSIFKLCNMHIDFHSTKRIVTHHFTKLDNHCYVIIYKVHMLKVCSMLKVEHKYNLSP